MKPRNVTTKHGSATVTSKKRTKVEKPKRVIDAVASKPSGKPRRQRPEPKPKQVMRGVVVDCDGCNASFATQTPVQPYLRAPTAKVPPGWTAISGRSFCAECRI